MQKGAKMTDEQRGAVSEKIRVGWENGTRVAPIVRLKDELADVKIRLTALEDWRNRIKAVMQKHNAVVELAKSKTGNPVGDFFRDLAEEMQ